MQRINLIPRPNWRTTVENLGFHFHTADNERYWDESVAYEFSAAQIDEVETATANLDEICLEAVQHVINQGSYEKLRIPKTAIDLIEKSFYADEPSMYGRFDLAYDGVNPPKLLEYNADTPTSLLEASVIQWQWLEETHAHADQFNSIHEKLVKGWKQFSKTTPIHFACMSEPLEDIATLTYLQDTALSAGLETVALALEEIGWNGTQFVDLDNRPIKTLFKLYPWEWLLKDEFGHHLRRATTHFIEPPWKMLLSNKAILPILWDLFPHHPHLLPAYTTPDRIDGPVIRKPFLSREGANIEVHLGKHIVNATSGPYGDEGFIYQQAASIPSFDGNFPVIGSWIIAGEPAGIGIREDVTSITTNLSRFVPHFFR